MHERMEEMRDEEGVEDYEEGSSGDDVVEIVETVSSDDSFIVDLKRHLTSRHAKKRSEKEACQIASTVLKFMSFSGSGVDPSRLYHTELLDTYLSHLEAEGKKATTQHATLCRLRQVLMFINLSLSPTDTNKAEKCLQLISNWLSNLGKEAKRVKRIRLEDLSDRGVAKIGSIERFAQSEAMRQLLTKTIENIKRDDVRQTELRKIEIWLAGSLLHSNAQRPGAVINATLAEYKSATTSNVGRDTYTTFYVENHKTSVTGRARLTLDQHLARSMNLYMTQIRPHLEGKSSPLIFPNREGKKLDHLSRKIEKLSTQLGISVPRTATDTRHATATAVAGSSDMERTAVAAAMSHSKQTQELYYQAKKGKKEAVDGFRVMESVRREEKEIEGRVRGIFTESDASTIKDYFQQHVQSRTPPTIDECREFLQQQGLGRTPKQIRDKVRNIIGRK